MNLMVVLDLDNKINFCWSQNAKRPGIISFMKQNVQKLNGYLPSFQNKSSVLLKEQKKLNVCLEWSEQ